VERHWSSRTDGLGWRARGGEGGAGGVGARWSAAPATNEYKGPGQGLGCTRAPVCEGARKVLRGELAPGEAGQRRCMARCFGPA
jgi:hypothetical protein